MANATLVQVGFDSSSGSTDKLPFNSMKVYGLSQQIYTSAEIGQSGRITEIQFYSSGAYSSRYFEVYLVHTDKTSFDGQYDWVPFTSADKVFEGSVWFHTNQIESITLATPFDYNNARNLAVIVYQNDVGVLTDPITFSKFDTSSNQAIYASSDMTNYDPSGLSGYKGTLANFKNCANFLFEDEEELPVIEIGSGEGTDSYFPTYVYYNYSLTQQIYTKEEIGAATKLKSISFYNASTSSRTRNLDIYLVPTDKTSFADGTDWLNFEDADKVFSGFVSFAPGEWTAIPFSIKKFDYDGTQNLAVIVDDNTGSYQSAVSFLVYEAEAQAIRVYSDGTDYEASGLSGYNGAIENVKNQIRFNEAVFETPSSITVSDIVWNGAKVTWVSEGTSWNLQYKKDGDAEWTTIPDLFTTECELTDLEQNTTYAVRVQLATSPADKGWLSTTFKTLEKYPRPTSLSVEEIDVDFATLKWTDNCGATAWEIWLYNGTTEEEQIIPANKNPFTLIDLDDNIKYYAAVRAVMGTEKSYWSETVNFTTPNRYAAPTDLELIDVDPRHAMVKWTENNGDLATGWEIIVYNYSTNVDYVVDAATNPYTLLDLDPGTHYEIWVRSKIGENKVSPWNAELYLHYSFEFDTPAANPAPFDVVVTPGQTSATIAWKGNNDSYIVKYKGYTFKEDFEGLATSATPEGWTVLDADGDGYNWYALNYTESGLSTTDTYGNATVFGEVCLTSASYYGSSPLAPDNWLITPKIDLTGTMSVWLRGQDPSYAEEHFAIYLSTTGTNPADFTTVLVPETVATTEYVEYTADLSAYTGQQGYIAIRHFNVYDMFRLNVDNFAIGTSEWTTIETTDKNVVIEGLDMDAGYEYQIIGVKEGEEDAVVGGSFTTLGDNPAPYDLAALPTATTAKLTWEGNSTIYQVQYRTAQDEPIFTDGFETGSFGSNWTTYAEDASQVPSGKTPWFVSDGTFNQDAGTYTAHTGSYMASSWSYKYPEAISYNASNWLISKKVKLGGKLTYWIRSYGGAYKDDYEVKLSTTGNSVSNFTTTLISKSSAPFGWTEFEADLSDFEGEEGYIAFHHVTNNVWGLLLDDVTVTHFEYGEWQNLTPTSAKEITITGLTPGNTYEFKVTGVKNGTPVESEIATFTTIVGDPVDLVLNNLGSNSSNISYYEGGLNNVTLNNLTLRKDNTWQTISLPFDVVIENSPLKGADVRTLESVTIRENYNVIIMNCPTPLTEIKAGYPYIIKWNGGTDIVNPKFYNVSLTTSYTDVTKDNVTFWGLHSKNCWTSSSYYSYNFYLSDSPVFTNIVQDAVVRAFECYVYLEDSSLASKINQIILNTGEENDIITGLDALNGETGDEIIYNVAGQRLAKKQKGINIVNGQKILVK